MPFSYVRAQIYEIVESPEDTDLRKLKLLVFPKLAETDSKSEQVPVMMTPPSLNSFQGFSRLPAELRLKIWGFARPDTRTFEILPRYVDYWRHLLEYRVYLRILNGNRIPSVLQVCSESRFATKSWFHIFTWQTRNGNQIWYDSKTETLLINGRDKSTKLRNSSTEFKSLVNKLGPTVDDSNYRKAFKSQYKYYPGQISPREMMELVDGLVQS